VDSTCSLNCELVPIEEKIISFSEGLYSEKIALNPYSTQLIILAPKPPEPEPPPVLAPVPAEGEKTEVIEAQNATKQEVVPVGNMTSGQ